MRMVSVHIGREELAALRTGEGLVGLRTLNAYAGASWPETMGGLLEEGALDRLAAWISGEGRDRLKGLPTWPEVPAPLYRRPRKIIGVGANYVEQAEQLAIGETGEPVSFLKPDTTLIGPGDPIRIPPESGRVTAEAELAVVIGRRCARVSEAEAREVVAGFAAAIDVTAADLHALNPRFLARAKSFDTFFSFGSELVTPEELGELSAMEVTTVLNGKEHARNRVGNMRYSPWFQVSFFSRVMTLLPGDIILTGTPGSAVIRHGDRIEGRVEGLAALSNPVLDAEYHSDSGSSD